MPQLHDWILFAISLFSVGSAAAGFFFSLGRLRQHVEDKQLDQGRRIGLIESKTSTHEGTLDELRRNDLKHDMEFTSLQRQTGEVGGKIDALLSRLDSDARHRTIEEKDITDRLARIEERLDTLIDRRKEVRGS